MSKKSFIDSVKVASPCSESWETMEGNERIRFCSHCSKSVNNLSEMTRKQATKFVRREAADICIRYFPIPGTNKPMFAEQLLQIARRTPSIAAGVMTASVALSSQAYAQSAPEPDAPWPPTQTNAVVGKAQVRSQKIDDGNVRNIRGRISDPNGAVIPNAHVRLVQLDSGAVRETASDGDGEYSFSSLEPTRYTLEIRSPGFSTISQVVDIQHAGQSVNGEMSIEGVNVIVDVRADLDLQVATAGGIGFVEYSSPLSTAIADEDVDAVRELLRRGTKVNAKEQEYNKITPLFVAVESGNVDVVQMLLAYGARPNARDASNQTPMWRLDSDSTPELVSLLVRGGAKVNLVDNEGRTPLMRAAEYAKPEVLQALIDTGSDLNHADNEGRTALLAAVDNGSVENVRTLLIAGAKVNAQNKDGDTALDLAEDDDVRELLLTYGATGKTKVDEKEQNQ